MNDLKNRRGNTLIELMATLSVLLVLGMASAKLMTSITRIGIRIGDRKTAVVMIQRLAGDFRKDVAQTQTMSIAQDAASIELIAGDATIRYAYDKQSGAIRRTETRQPETKQPETKQSETEQSNARSETYKLTERCQPKFVADNNLVTLQLTPAGQPNQWAIEAAKP